MDKIEKDSKPKKDSKLLLYSIILIVIGVILASACIFTNCFKTKEVQPITQRVVLENNYDYLIDNWNKSVTNTELSDYYLLPRDDNNQSLEKLNILLNDIETVEGFEKKSQCVLKYNSKSIFIPSFMYLDFLKEYANYNKVNFSTKDKEDDIITKVKKITKSKYFDNNVVEKVAYLHSFEIFFQKNKKQFYKKGFTENIKDYKIYEEAVSQCK